MEQCNVPAVVLTREQQKAVNYLAAGRDEKSLGGLAGSAKTTVAAPLHQRLPDFVVCCPTKKAASVLRKKGAPAVTVHAAIYWTRELAGGGLKYDRKPSSLVPG